MPYWIKQLEYTPDSTVTTPVWTGLGQIHTDSAHNSDAAAEETSEGNEVYAGTQDAYDMRLYDESTFTDLKAISDADGTVDLRFTNAKTGEVATIETGFSVIVNKIKTFNPRTRQAYAARFVRTTV